MSTPILWPRDLLRPQSYSPGYDPQSANGGRLTLSGRIDNGGVPGRGIWRPAWIDAPVRTPAERAAVMALDAAVMGRDRPVLVPYLHGGHRPSGEAPAGEPTFEDGASFADGTTFATRATAAHVATDANAGDVMVRIRKRQCGPIAAGHTFSIEDHLYRVRSVEEQDDDFATVEILPELRADIENGDWVEFDRPVVRCRLADPTALSPEWSAPFRTALTVQFVEDTAP
jgi:hypothetical protein